MSKLLELRKKIDDIDNQLIDLLNKRIEIIKEVGEYKKSINDQFFIKSAREADMIKNLISKADPAIPKSTIVNIWRKIITSANMLEQTIHIAIHNPNKVVDYQYLVREYYGDFTPLSSFDSASHVISELEKGKAQIGIFALPHNNQIKHDHWWISLANNNKGIKIFAKIPFIGKSDYDLVAVAIKEPEQSEEDLTLLSLEVSNQFSHHDVENVLKESGLKFKTLCHDKIEQVNDVSFYLIEVDGFFIDGSPEILALSKSKAKSFVKVLAFVKVLGHFAKTID